MENPDYGVLRNKTTGQTKAIWIKMATITDIYDTSGHPYSKIDWEQVYRGPKEGYTGPHPDSIYPGIGLD